MIDLQGKNTESLKEKKLFLFDMDGTIYEEDRLFDGAKDLLNWIHEIEGKFVFITNNSSKSVEDYISKLTGMDICVSRDNFFTSSQATALYLTEYHKGEQVFCMGTKSLIKEFRSFGIDVTDEKDDNAQVVVVGYDSELTYKKLRDTCELIYRGLPFIATNPDRGYPVKFGFIPDCGAICEALYLATNRRPKFIGKPEPVMVDYVVQNSKFNKKETVLIGDRLYTDIASAINAQITSICVLTGETKWDHLKTGEIKPDYVFKSVKEIFQTLKT